MGYWKYLATVQTPNGQDETLFTYKLENPNASATAFIFKPDSGWIFSQPIDGVSLLEFTGAHLATVAPNMCPGSIDSIFIRIENEFGADTAFTTINVGEFFDGVQIADSSANWTEDFVFPAWFCEDNSLNGPFNGSSLKSSVNRQNYVCGVLTNLLHSTDAKFNLKVGCTVTGTASCDYTILSDRAQPREEYWDVNFTFDSPFQPAIISPDGSDYFLFLNVSDVSARVTQKQVWTFSDKPDSVWTDSGTLSGGMFLGIEGQILF